MSAPTWSIAECDPAVAAGLSRTLGLHPLVARVLAARGVTETNAARSFLAPRLADLTRPEGMADRDIAADRIHHAIERGERIALFGDYDVDGTTSAALLSTALKAFGADVVAMVASRFDGGYGLSDTAADRIAATNPKLLITCDCGTSDHPRLARLKALGIESIVVDHHKVPSEPLPALAFLNPHRDDCGFPFKGLASVGLALSVAAAVRAKRNSQLDLRMFLDMVAVGTIADVMPLTGDNRILTRAGLERLAAGQGSPGLRALAREAKLTGRVRAHDVAFYIAPMLNASGRLGAATPTLELLLCQSENEAATLARNLMVTNEARRKISAELVDAAIAQVKEVYGTTTPAGIVLGAEGWHPGVGGIVAGRIAERFGAPAVVCAFSNGVGVGSARAPKGFALYEAVSSCSSDLEQFGGHDAAAGMKVRIERFESFRASFADACARQYERIGGRGPGDQRVDTELTERDLDGTIAAHLEALEPTGQAHSEPWVMIRDVRLSDVRPVGTGHLRAKVGIGNRRIGAFVRDGEARRSRGDFEGLDRGGAMNVIGRLRPDTYAGNGAVQIEIDGIRSSR